MVSTLVFGSCACGHHAINEEWNWVSKREGPTIEDKQSPLWQTKSDTCPPDISFLIFLKITTVFGSCLQSGGWNFELWCFQIDKVPTFILNFQQGKSLLQENFKKKQSMATASSLGSSTLLQSQISGFGGSQKISFSNPNSLTFTRFFLISS